MKPKLLMICLLRSSAARALATHPRGGVGVQGVTRSRALFSCARGGAISALDGERSCGESSTSLHVASQNVREEAANTATSDDDGSGSNTSPILSSGHIAFRLARRTDVPQIQSCNLATLPENYNANFYVNHMRTWPELTLVAEHIPEGCDREDPGDSERITPLRDYIRNKQREERGPRKEIVGYILGKVEERPVNPQRQIFPASRVPLYDQEDTLMRYMNNPNGGGNVRFPSRRRDPPPPPPPMERIGHVTSLAVHSHARRLGIASNLLNQLHYHLEECHGADSVGLHVRVSNKAAVRLYCEEGYDVADIIPLYYGDGEDAYFMKKDFGTISEAMPAPESRDERQQRRRYRRGEKERDEWLNRDAARGGSFFDGRKSMRETLSEEERAWVNSNSSINGGGRNGNSRVARNAPAPAPSLSGQFRRSFQTFFSNNGGDQTRQLRRKQQGLRLPPWEVGPEGLRLPRYCRVVRPAPRAVEVEAEAVQAAVAEEEAPSNGIGMSLKDLVTKRGDDDIDDVQIDVDGYEVEEDDALFLDARVVSGSV